MKRKFIALSLLLLSTLGFASKWEVYKSPEGKFSVLLPVIPGRTVRKLNKTINTAGGSVDMKIFVLKSSNVIFYVSYADYPLKYIEKASSKKLLDNGRDGALNKVKGSLVSEKEISINKHPGRDIEILAKSLKLYARLYIVNNRLYQLIAIAPNKNVSVLEIKKFQKSFKLLN
ncbi:MAG: hypothetical protein OEV44_14445 [Spirochaetota bacterium]|nr:hypothetical protein [Spirochaetota bacterium]